MADTDNRLARLLTNGDPYGYGNPDEGQPAVKEVGSQSALADYLAAAAAGFVDPWGLTGYGLRGLSAVSPNTLDPNTANQLAGISSSIQNKSPAAAGATSMLVPGIGAGRLAGGTMREVLHPSYLAALMGIGGAVGNLPSMIRSLGQEKGQAGPRSVAQQHSDQMPWSDVRDVADGGEAYTRYKIKKHTPFLQYPPIERNALDK